MDRAARPDVARVIVARVIVGRVIVGQEGIDQVARRAVMHRVPSGLGVPTPEHPSS